MGTIRRLNPPTLFGATALSFSQVAISHGQTLIHLAGQAALDRELNVVHVGDFARQLEVAFENLRLALAAAEAGPCDVVSLRIYVVGLDATCVPPLQHALESFFPDGCKPPSTLLGVAALALPDLRVEIEAAAIRKRSSPCTGHVRASGRKGCTHFGIGVEMPYARRSARRPWRDRARATTRRDSNTPRCAWFLQHSDTQRHRQESPCTADPTHARLASSPAPR